MKIDKIIINDESINFETGTAKELDDGQFLKYIKVTLMGKKIPEQILQAFRNNDLIDVNWFTKDGEFIADFIVNSYSIDSLLNYYELELMSSGAITGPNQCG